MNLNQVDSSTFCIGNVASLNTNQTEVYRRLKLSGLLMDYIIGCYDVLHTFGRLYLVEDITSLMKKKTVITALLAILTVAGYADNRKISNRTEGSITFVVDGNLAPVNEPYLRLYNGEDLAEFMLSGEQISKDVQRIIATSFSGENCSATKGDACLSKIFRPMGKDAFYSCIVRAYANHQSVTLSPDMVWLVISQGFARYVNAHAEELRPKLVNHEGKMDLAIMSENDLLAGENDWPSLIDSFSSQIDRYTNDDIAKTITSDFTTTGSVERVASQITLMESVKSYFEYIVYWVACGIPSVTLQGAVGDWQRVLEKTRQLKQYGLESWVSQLEPILQEFIQAADAHPNQTFWKSMVKKQSIAKLKGGGCSLKKPTKLDGWLLKLFPDEDGKTLDEVQYNKEMPSEYVRVGFKYRVIDPVNGNIISETPMELWAGFIGAQVDTINNVLTPKIGWLVRVAESEDDILNELKKKNDDWGIHLRVQEVPEVLSRLKHIEALKLVFTGKVVLPEWMDQLTIDNFTIIGEMTDAEKAAIRKRFPNVIF